MYRLNILIVKANEKCIQYYFKADGRWYHRNQNAAYSGKDKIKYTITAEIDGKTIETKGKLHPGLLNRQQHLTK